MLTAVVTSGLAIEVRFVSVEEGEGHSGEMMSYEASQDFCEFPYETEAEYEAEAEAAHPCLEGPSPIAPELKEIAWGAGSFIVLALLMRFFLYPRLKKGTDARYALIRDGHEQADTARAAARACAQQTGRCLAAAESRAVAGRRARSGSISSIRAASVIRASTSGFGILVFSSPKARFWRTVMCG